MWCTSFYLLTCILAEGFGDIPNIDFKANDSGQLKALEEESLTVHQTTLI